MKTHPNSEEWMPFLYGEASTEDSSKLEAHLRQCADCRKRVGQWRASMAALDAWSLPAVARRRRGVVPVLRWAAAAAVVLGLGIGVGRMTVSPSARFQQLEISLRAEMETRMAASRAEFAAALEKQGAGLGTNVQTAASQAARREAEQLLVKFARTLDEQRDADRDVYVTALRNLEERRASEFASLRKDLDTLAVNADDGLSRTQEQLMELASMTQPPAN